MTEELEVTQDQYTCQLAINRPDRRNALSHAVLDVLQSELRRADSDPNIRSIVITGTGTKSFCAGADLQKGSAFEFDYADPMNEYSRLLRMANELTKPLIAKINGACMAGGMGLLGMSDFAVASNKATFGLPEVKVGVFPMQVLAVLQGIIPEQWISRLCITGETISAEQAKQIGLVTDTTDDLDTYVEELTALIANNSPTAIRRGIYTMKRNRHLSFEQSISFVEGQIGLIALTEDAKEGLSAFVAKRAPNWTGK